METGTQLVQRGELEKTLGELLNKERIIVEDLRKILPHVRDENMKKGLQQRLSKGEECISALEAGFVPVDTGYFIKVETKSKWHKKAVKEALEAMPEEANDAWERIKELGVFKSFSISIGGDPQLVGNAGGKHFLIAAWVTLAGGYSVGFRVRR